MKWQPYPKYKDSGEDWLGAVPEGWETRTIKRTSYLKGRVGWKGLTSQEYQTDGYAYLVTGTDFNDKFIDWDSCHFITQERYEDDPFIQLSNGDLLITKDGTIGKVSLVKNLDKPACLNSGIFLVRPLSSFINEFLYWVLSSFVFKEFIRLRASGTTILHLYQNVFEEFIYPVPSIEEQQAIATFLDKETGRIDALIAKKKTLIEKLKEQRTAIISNAVTRGLPDDVAPRYGLVPHTHFKLSDVDWLGHVPKGWEIKAIKWISSVQRGASPRPIDDPIYFDDEGEYSWVRIADVTASDRYLTQTTQRLSRLGSSLSVKLCPNELFLSIAATVGKPCISKIKCCIHDGFVYFPQLKENTDFLFYIFACGQPYLGLGKFGTQLNLNTDTVGSIKVALPPLEEQQAIASYLDEQTGKIDTLIAKVEQAITTLQEYRSALITAAVTGKIDVRNEAHAQEVS